MGMESAHVVIVNATLITMAVPANVVIIHVIYMMECRVVDQVAASVVVEGVCVDLVMLEKHAIAPLKLRHVCLQGTIAYVPIKGSVCVEDATVEMGTKECFVRILYMQLECVKN